MAKWQSVAGPIQTKRVNKALAALLNERHAHIEVSGVQDGRTPEQVIADNAAAGNRNADGSWAFHVSRYYSFGFGGPKVERADITAVIDALGEKYGWTITRENAAQVVKDAEAALPAIVAAAPIVDKRRTPEEDAESSARLAASRAADQARDQARKAAEEAIRAKMPAGAGALIVAHYERDDSDLQSDYFGTHRLASFAIGWRSGSRDDFAQMRAAARVFFLSGEAPLIQCDGKRYAGSQCVHGESGAHTFAPEFGEAAFAGLHEEREKYSMGRGYYLATGSGGHGTGWMIRAEGLSGWGLVVDALPDAAIEGQSSAYFATQQAGDVRVRPSPVRAGYVEVAFPAKPDPDTLAELRAAGFRWALRSRCWYGPAARLPERYKAAEAAA